MRPLGPPRLAGFMAALLLWPWNAGALPPKRSEPKTKKTATKPAAKYKRIKVVERASPPTPIDKPADKSPEQKPPPEPDAPGDPPAAPAPAAPPAATPPPPVGPRPPYHAPGVV